MNITSSFSKAQDVVNIQNQVLQTISGQTRSFSNNELNSLSKIIKEKEIDGLLQLKNYFLKQEAEFYSYNKIKDYKDLAKKVDQWNNSGINDILRNQKLIHSITDYLNSTENSDFFENIKNFIDWELAPIVIQDALGKDGIFEEIGQEIKDVIITGFSHSIKGASKNKREGFMSITLDTPGLAGKKTYKKIEKIKGITFIKNPKKGQVEIRFTHDINKKKREEILKKFEEKDDNKELKRIGTSQVEKYEHIYTILVSYIKNLNIDSLDIKRSFEKTVRQAVNNKQKVDFNRNSSVIYGALGELYAAAFAKHFGFNYQLTGYDLLSLKDKQVPTDIIFKGAGAQVKNYYKEDGIVTFNQHFDKSLKKMIPNKISLYTFLTGASYLQLSNPEVFGNFYFSEVYNRYNPEKAGGNTSYKSIESRFVPIRSAINTYAKSALDKLLNFNHEIELKNADLIQEDFRGVDVGKPAFYFIGEKVIPTSEMIDDIILGLKNTNEIVSIKIKDFLIDTSSFNETKERWPKEIEKLNVIGSLKGSSVQYRIDVNVDALVEKILRK